MLTRDLFVVAKFLLNLPLCKHIEDVMNRKPIGYTPAMEFMPGKAVHYSTRFKP